VRQRPPKRRWIARLLAGAAALAAGNSHAAPSAAPAPAVTVFAAGDIARCAHPDPVWSGAAGTAAVVEAGLAADPQAVVLALGDLTYPRGAAEEFANCYAPTWGKFKDRTWPVPGNHEYYTPQAAPYFAYFGARAARGYYSMTLGSWRLIALDSNLAAEAHAAQLAWLRDELAGNPARCTLAYWHHPLYSSGGHGSIPKMRDAWDLLYRAGAELVLAGHDHDYERFAPQDAHGKLDRERGIRQFVVGTGGAYATPLLRTVNNSELRDSNRNGVLRLRLAEGGYEWQFIESSNSVPNAGPADHGSAQCH
jgi:3',5'-cyclic AMP phosphodiesterase CpdA